MAVKDEWADNVFTKADADYLADFFEDRLPSAASASVATSESTSSTSYTNLTTTTDQVSVSVGPMGIALVSVSAWMHGGAVGRQCFVSFQLSGANARTPDDVYATRISTPSSGGQQTSGVFVLTGLNPGGTVFKMKYRATGLSDFENRSINVVSW